MLKTVSSITNAIGALNFKGTWNASTNTPTIVSGVGVKGDYFVVSVAGSTTIDGLSNWGVGDWITYNGTVWQRVEGGADLNGVNLSVSGTTTLSNLTASTALALNASKEVVSVTNTGTGNNVLADGPTLTTPRVVTSINDTNGNEVFGITATGSAVNELTIANAATGNNPQISATGGDTNIGITLTPKGTGNTIFSSGNVGIGTTSPATTLQVVGGFQARSLVINNEQVGNVNTISSITGRFGSTANNSAGLLLSPNLRASTKNNQQSFVQIAGTVSNNIGGSQADNLYALRIEATTGQTVDNAFGLFVAAPTIGSSLNLAAQFSGTIRYTNRPAAGTITAIGFDTNGDLKASSSSLRYKHEIEDYNKGLSEVMQLRPVSFKFNGEDRTNIGFIAEEIDELGLTEVMLYDEEEKPEGIIYANMVSLLTKAIQELKAELDTVKAELQTLKGN